MKTKSHIPLVEFTRGETRESVHYGSLAVVNPAGQLVASAGDPGLVTFMRSSAKPFQLLPLLENNGAAVYALTDREIALMCASHSGSDTHVRVLESLQGKIGVQESDLLCGVHMPIDEAAADRLKLRDELPTPNCHNCSGKHTGMLAFARLKGSSPGKYLDPEHPIQKEIRTTLAEMAGILPETIAMGTDGCSAPNFAVPLWAAARAFARLCAPEALSPVRADACRRITRAMHNDPEMVAGPGRFDTRLMAAAGGSLVAKGGAEGYQAIGILPGAISPGSSALGIAIKISDGDPKGRARPIAALAVLQALGVLPAQAYTRLDDLGPRYPVKNWRGLIVGEARPCFRLQFHQPVGSLSG